MGDQLILVTGAAGHVGANLVHRLVSEGLSVRVLLRENENNAAVEDLDVERFYADITDPTTTTEVVSGCTHVYHCAAKVSTIDGDARHKRELFDCNVLGTRHVLQAARNAGVTRVIVTGSFSAVGYDLQTSSEPSDEEMPFYPFHRCMPYERTKVLVEHECLKAVADGLDVVVATCCAVIGGHDHFPSRMGRTLCDYVNGSLKAYIQGGFEFVSTRDIVSGHLLAMGKGRTGHKYIFGTEFLTLDDILNLFEQASGVKRSLLRIPGPLMYGFSEIASPYLSHCHPAYHQRLTPGAIRLLRMRRSANKSKAMNELGYRPTSIRAAIYEAYAFHFNRGAIRNSKARDPVLNPISTPHELSRHSIIG